MMSLEWNPLPKTLSPEKRYRKPFSYSWPWGIFSLCEGHHIFPLSCRTFLFFSVRVAYDRSDCVIASKVLSSASAPPPSSPRTTYPAFRKDRLSAEEEIPFLFPSLLHVNLAPLSERRPTPPSRTLFSFHTSPNKKRVRGQSYTGWEDHCIPDISFKNMSKWW